MITFEPPWTHLNLWVTSDIILVPASSWSTRTHNLKVDTWKFHIRHIVEDHTVYILTFSPHESCLNCPLLPSAKQN